MRASQKSFKQSAVGVGGSTNGTSRKWTIISIITVGLVVIGAALFFIVGGIMGGDKSELEQYLEEKYDKKFVVEDIRSNAVGLGMSGQQIGTAYPVENHSLVFEVGKSRSTGVYFDGYSAAVWAQEERPRVISLLEGIYDEQSVPRFSIKTLIPTDASPDPIKGQVPNIDEAIAKYKDNFVYDITLQLVTDHELSQNEIDEHIVKIKRIVDFVLSKGVSSPTVRYAINVEGQNVGYLCDLYKEQLTDQDSISNCLTQKRGKAW